MEREYHIRGIDLRVHCQDFHYPLSIVVLQPLHVFRKYLIGYLYDSQMIKWAISAWITR